MVRIPLALALAGLLGLAAVLWHVERSTLDPAGTGRDPSAWAQSDLRQQTLAHVPLLLADQALDRVLALGPGTGILIAELAAHPQVREVVCLEARAEVIAAARTEAGALRIKRGNALRHLRRGGSPYDLILSEAHVRDRDALLSQEFYALCRDRLALHGLLAQDLPLDLDPEELRRSARSMFAIFPHGGLWIDPPHTCLLIGSREPLAPDPVQIQQRLDAPASAALRRHGWCDAREVVGAWVDVHAGLSAWMDGASGPFAASADRANRDGSQCPTRQLLRACGQMQPGPTPPEESLALIDSLLMLAPDPGRVRWTTHTLCLEQAAAAARLGRMAIGIAWLQRAVEARPDQPESRFQLANALAAAHRLEEATTHYQAVIHLTPGFAGAHFNLANTLALRGDYLAAADAYRAALELRPDMSPARDRLHSVLRLQEEREFAAQPDYARTRRWCNSR